MSLPTAGAMISPGGQRRAVVDRDDADAVDAALLLTSSGAVRVRHRGADDLCSRLRRRGASSSSSMSARQSSSLPELAHRRADHDRTETIDLPRAAAASQTCLRFPASVELRQAIDGVLGDDHEQSGVDGVDAFAQDRRAAGRAGRDGRRPSPRSPRKARASWKLLHGTTRPSVWLGGNGSPSRA